MAMAMANLVSRTYSIPLPLGPHTSKRPSSRYKRSFYTPPTSSFVLPLSRSPLSVHLVEPISVLLKEKSGIGGNSNWGDLSRIDSLSFWDSLTQNDEKFQCQWRKKDDVADAEEDTKLQKSKIHGSTKTFGSELRPKLYTILVGASFCVAVGVCSFMLPKLRAPHYTVVPYSDLVKGIREESVTRVQFVENSRKVYFNTKSLEDQDDHQTDSLAKETSTPKWQYHTRTVEDDKYGLIMMLKEKGITYGSDPGLLPVPMQTFLIYLLQSAPYWIMVLLTCYQLNVQLNLGKMTKRKPSKKESVTFDDVEGVDAAKAELLEIVMCIKGDSKYMKLGAKLPKGVLLAGPPGTGKTLLARAVAGEAGVSFFSISASELVEVFVGRGAARVRDLFREARKNSPSIIFIDEIDAVGGQRGRTLNCERDQTLNQLLTDMDGFEKEKSVVVIAATNRPETLDSALMRPGRFSRKVTVAEPDEDGRRKIFALYLRQVPMEEEDKDAICKLVASRTPGLVGADLENIAHESVLLAARRGGDFVTKGDIVEAIERATAKMYSGAPDAKPFSFEPTTQERVQFGGGTVGFSGI